jgi:hypothetical protein
LVLFFLQQMPCLFAPNRQKRDDHFASCIFSLSWLFQVFISAVDGCSWADEFSLALGGWGAFVE